MPRLGDAYDEAADAWARRRLYLGATLLFVGAAVAAPGLVRVAAGAFEAAGVGEAPARSLAIAVAALAVPIAGAGLIRWVPASPRLRLTGALGVLLSTVAVAAFLAIVGPADLTGPASVPLAIILVYGVGFMLALWSPIVAAGLAASSRKRRGTSATFVRQSRTVKPRARIPADGGMEEEQLAFLLDHDEK